MSRLSSAQAKSEMPQQSMARRSLSILGATGSIGKSTLDLVGRSPDAFEIIALTAQNNAVELAESAKRVGARLAVIGNEQQYGDLKSLLSGTSIRVAAGPTSIAAAAAEPADCVVAAIVGAAGLEPTFEAVRQGRRLALANKECLVSAGAVFMTEVAQAGTELLPVDSEHSAAFQVIGDAPKESIDRLMLTASGGPFRTWDEARIAVATPEEALRHPNWSMGPKVTIDSATLMNKGLELIEAYHLFPVDTDQLGVVVHPQSIVHCLVSFSDGSVVAQLASPDMRTPIALSLSWPQRMVTPTKKLDLVELGSLTFEAPNEEHFPALRLAREALHRGATAPAVLNATNEVAVEAFLARRIPFPAIANIVEQCLDVAESWGLVRHESRLAGILDVDAEARRLAHSMLHRYV
jgi:1-deoxy-D-xylulose-5-phosphate reductoisomerase